MFFKSKKDFSTLGTSFQEKLVHIIAKDRSFADQIQEVLDYDYFDLKYLRKFVKELYDYRKDNDFYPTEDMIDIILKTKYSIADAKPSSVNVQIHNFYENIEKNKEIKKEEVKFVKEKSLDFCKKQNFKKAIVQSEKLLNRGSFDDVQRLVNEALKLGSENNFGYDYQLDFNARYVKNHRATVPTPWKEMNDVVGGGHGKGELGVIIAPTGCGKSMICCALGAHAVKSGYNVVYYTLELQDTVIGQRFDSCITGIDLNDLFDNKQQVFDTVKNMPGKLIIKEYPAKRASVTTLERHLEKLITTGFEPDVVIVDYGDLLKPVGYNNELRISLGQIYEELRGLAKQFNVAIWSPTQTNRKGYNSPVVTMEDISEAFNKCFTADLIFSFSRTADDKSQGGGRFFLGKNRNGRDGILFPARVRLDNIYFEILPATQETIEDFLKNESKKNLSSLQSKFEKFKENI